MRSEELPSPDNNVASLGFDVTDLTAKKKLLIDHVQVNRNDIDENGEYDLRTI